MKKQMIGLAGVLLTGLVLFVGVPYLIYGMLSNTSDKAHFIGPILLWFIYPVYSVLSGFIYCANHPFRWYLSVIVGALFLAAIGLNLFGWSVGWNALLYAVLTLLGSCAGFAFRQHRLVAGKREKK